MYASNSHEVVWGKRTCQMLVAVGQDCINLNDTVRILFIVGFDQTCPTGKLPQSYDITILTVESGK